MSELNFWWRRPDSDISFYYLPIPHRNDSLSLIRAASPSSEAEEREEENSESQRLLHSSPDLNNLPDLEDPPEEGTSERERRVSFRPSPGHGAGPSLSDQSIQPGTSASSPQERRRRESEGEMVERRSSFLRGSSAVRMVATTSKTKHRTFMTLNFCLILLGTLGVVLTIKDMSNSKMGFRNLRNAKKEFFDVGNYPMGGMAMLMAGGCLDGISMFIFLCGYFCECQYYRHYMRFVFVNLLLAITATIVLFLTQENADHYLQRYFEMIMLIEYGATAHPEPLGNFIDSVQQAGDCCGFNKPEDWKKTAWWENGNAGKLPSTCCKVTPIPTTGSKEKSHLIPLCTFAFIDRENSGGNHKTGCKDIIFPIKGAFRIYAKFVGMVKVAFLVAVVVLCSMLYKDTWYMKHSQSLDEGMLIQHDPLEEGDPRYKSGILADLPSTQQSYPLVSEPQSTISSPRKPMKSITENGVFDQRVGHRLMLYDTNFSDNDPRIAPV